MTTLFLIDVQNDFHPGGSLAIPAAGADAGRIASLISSHKSSINRIVATMDSHHKLHIAHGSFWTDENGNHPPPFTLISCDDISSEKWKPRSDLKMSEGMVDKHFLSDNKNSRDIFDSSGTLNLKKYCAAYTAALEEKGKFQLVIWPEHCLIGSPGHNVVEVVRNAMEEWGESTGCSVEWVLKGQNLLTEMYSVFQAEVPLSESTSFNLPLSESLRMSDKVLVGGQALSHCLAQSVRDLVEKWPEEDRKKVWIMTDCSSAVPGFEKEGSKFLDDMKAAGVNLCTSDEAIMAGM